MSSAVTAPMPAFLVGKPDRAVMLLTALPSRSPLRLASPADLTTEPRQVSLHHRPETVADGTIGAEINTAAAGVRVPVHPIPSMQEAFTESFIESQTSDQIHAPDFPRKVAVRYEPDPQARYDLLLSEPADAHIPALLWRYRPGQTQHELWKLVAQISFGLHLLLQGKANDKAPVVQLLQSHIDEIDEFLEVAFEDVSQLSKALNNRAAYLRLSVQELPPFEASLQGSAFRIQVLKDNATVSHILSRTRILLRQYMHDVQEGSHATRDFAAHLNAQNAASSPGGHWRHNLSKSDLPAVTDVFEAMKSNTEGWLIAFADLSCSLSAIDELATNVASVISTIFEKVGRINGEACSLESISNNDESRSSRQLSTKLGMASNSATDFGGRLCSDSTLNSNVVVESPKILPSVTSLAHHVDDPISLSAILPAYSSKGPSPDLSDWVPVDAPSAHLQAEPCLDSVQSKLTFASQHAGPGVQLPPRMLPPLPQLQVETDLPAESLVDTQSCSAVLMGEEDAMEAEAEAGAGAQVETDAEAEGAILDEAQPNTDPDQSELAVAHDRVRESNRDPATTVLQSDLTLSASDREPGRIADLQDDLLISQRVDMEQASEISTDGEEPDAMKAEAENPIDEPNVPVDPCPVVDHDELYILQPRTYTPPISMPPPERLAGLVPEPASRPSFRLSVASRFSMLSRRASTISLESPESLESPYSPSSANTPYSPYSPQIFTEKDRQPGRISITLDPASIQAPNEWPQSSILQRVALRTTPPDHIFIPPAPPWCHGAVVGKFPTSIDTADHLNTCVDSDGESDGGNRQSYLTAYPVRNPAMASYCSDHHAWARTLHSPNIPRSRPMSAGAQNPLSGPEHGQDHKREQSREGGSRGSGLGVSNGANRATYRSLDNHHIGKTSPSLVEASSMRREGDGKARKKKSAFGWLKKAFTMDDAERAAFETRRRQHTGESLYQTAVTPLFLDGRRLR